MTFEPMKYVSIKTAGITTFSFVIICSIMAIYSIFADLNAWYNKLVIVLVWSSLAYAMYNATKQISEMAG